MYSVGPYILSLKSLMDFKLGYSVDLSLLFHVELSKAIKEEE